VAKTTELQPREIEEPKPVPTPRPHRSRRWPVALFLVVAMLGSLAIAAGSVYGITLYHKAEGAVVVIPPPTDPAVADDPDAVVPKCGNHVCNYLILGSDSRKGLSKAEQIKYGSDKSVPGRRSDTIMVVHVDPAQEHATVLSFPRDLWVHIPHVGMGKITSAYEEGEYRVANVVHRLTGLTINGFLTVNLAGFEGVVRALGGVDICVDRAMVDPLAGLDIPAGCQHLSPEMALSFVRARHVCGDAIPDFSRISRQQQFLRAVLSNVLSTGAILHADSIINEVLPNLRVSPDIKPADILFLVNELRGLSTGAVDFRTVPGNPYATVQTDAGTVDVVKLEPQAKELFKRLRLGLPLGNLGLATERTPPSPAVVDVQVVDSASGGVAAQVKDLLDKAGFLTHAEASTNTFGAQGPAIVFNPSPQGKAAADVVKGYLGKVPEVRAAPGVLKPNEVAVIVDAAYQGNSVAPAPQPSGGSTPPAC
jgi:LCP family protein required for cell wall assembly